MKHGKITALLLALALVLSLGGCARQGGDPTDSPSPSQTTPVTPTPTPEPTLEPTLEPVEGVTRLGVLSGPTGIGAAKLLRDIEADEADGLFDFIIAADNTELTAGLTSGELDIATVASNVAVNLYNRTDGGVKIIALGTLGVLHILEGSGGVTIDSIADLEGKTIYSAGQGANPEFILRYLLAENGLDPDADVDIVFADASEISAKLLSGDIQYAMLPVPAATAAIIRGAGEVRAAVDVTQAWNDLNNGSQLIMTAVVARTEFLEEHPDLVAGFLAQYEASIQYVTENVDEAAELIAQFGITPNAAIAKQAIPQCHLTYIAGADMAPAISDYFMELYAVSPSAVGGALPDDGIYYVP